MLGWIGTILIVLAYVLLSCHYVNGESRVYHLINLFGAIGIGINVFYREDWSTFVLEVIWATIATVSLYSLYRT